MSGLHRAQAPRHPASSLYLGPATRTLWVPCCLHLHAHSSPTPAATPCSAASQRHRAPVSCSHRPTTAVLHGNAAAMRPGCSGASTPDADDSAPACVQAPGLRPATSATTTRIPSSQQKQAGHEHSSLAPRQASSQPPSCTTPSPEGITGSQDHLTVTRRTMAYAAAALVAMLVPAPWPAAASKLPAFADQAWESMGGGPSDLYFPDSFLGVWEVSSILTSVDKPLGEQYILNKQAVQRAIQDDLMKETRYRVQFIAAGNGRAIFDRRFNTAAMLEMYYGPEVDFSQRVTWNPADPNVLRLSVPGGMSVRTRVTRRSSTAPAPDRLETSEYFEQIYDDGSAPPRLKANQCFTKYKWRDAEVAARAGGPAVVATQVVSDFLTPFDGESLYMQAMNRPVAIYTYKMAFRRPDQVQV